MMNTQLRSYKDFSKLKYETQYKLYKDAHDKQRKNEAIIDEQKKEIRELKEKLEAETLKRLYRNVTPVQIVVRHIDTIYTDTTEYYVAETTLNVVQYELSYSEGYTSEPGMTISYVNSEFEKDSIDQVTFVLEPTSGRVIYAGYKPTEGTE